MSPEDADAPALNRSTALETGETAAAKPVDAEIIDAVVQQLTEAVANLVWMSETDAPFEVLQWQKPAAETLSPAEVLATAQLPPTTPVQVLDLETFLAPVTQPQDWHTAEEQSTIQRFQALQTLLQQTLRSLQVYRCGTTELEIYVVGQAIGPVWIALHTSAVET